MIGALFVVLFFLTTPSFAQNYYNSGEKPAAVDDDGQTAGPVSHTVVVTSIEKCYKQLGHDQAIDIEQHFTKPYEECQRRLALKMQQQHEVKPGQSPQKTVSPTSPIGASATPPVTDAPQPGAAAPLSDEGLYYRVQKNALPPPPEENPFSPPVINK